MWQMSNFNSIGTTTWRSHFHRLLLSFKLLTPSKLHSDFVSHKHRSVYFIQGILGILLLIKLYEGIYSAFCPILYGNVDNCSILKISLLSSSYLRKQIIQILVSHSIL